MGALVDVTGMRIDQIEPKLIQQIVAEYPRDGTKALIGAMLKHQIDHQAAFANWQDRKRRSMFSNSSPVRRFRVDLPTLPSTHFATRHRAGSRVGYRNPGCCQKSRDYCRV